MIDDRSTDQQLAALTRLHKRFERRGIDYCSTLYSRGEVQLDLALRARVRG